MPLLIRPSKARQGLEASASSGVKLSESALWRLIALIAANQTPTTAMQKVLAILGRYSRVDRVWVAQYNDTLTHFWNTHEWTRRGIDPFVDSLQGVPVSMIAWAHDKFLRREPMVLDNLNRIPRAGRALQAELRRQKVISTVTVPLYDDDALIGFFGYDMVKEPKAWRPELIKFLEQISVYLSALVMKERQGNQRGSLQAVPVPEQIVYVRHANAMLAVDTAKIIFIRASGDYSHLQLTLGRSFTVLRSLKSWETVLPVGAFIKVHKQYLVRKDAVTQLRHGQGRSWEVVLRNWDTALPVGRSSYAAVRGLAPED